MTKQETEYECQFWRFCAKEISTGLKEAIFDSLEVSVTKMFHAIQKRNPGDNLTVLSKNCQTLLDELAINSKEQIINFEKYILETFSIPKHILLKEDTIQRQQYTKEERIGLETEIHDLWKEIDRVHFMEFYLSKEMEKHKQTEAISQRLESLDLPPVDSLPNPKQVHHPVLDSLGLEVEEASCHLNGEEETEENNSDLRENVLKLLYTKRKRVP